LVDAPERATEGRGEGRGVLPNSVGAGRAWMPLTPSRRWAASSPAHHRKATPPPANRQHPAEGRGKL